jgi:hypothetical protein
MPKRTDLLLATIDALRERLDRIEREAQASRDPKRLADLDIAVADALAELDRGLAGAELQSRAA